MTQCTKAASHCTGAWDCPGENNHSHRDWALKSAPFCAGQHNHRLLSSKITPFIELLVEISNILTLEKLVLTQGFIELFDWQKFLICIPVTFSSFTGNVYWVKIYLMWHRYRVLT